MKYMIAGLGSIGRRHLRNLKALGENDILLYRTHRSTLPDDELAGLPVETELEAALAMKPDAVLVTNPTALHLDVAIPAAAAGCALFIEKPVSHSLDRLDELQAAAKSGGGQVLVGFQFRFHPGLRKIAELLEDEAIGQPLSVHAHWGEYLPYWHPWEDYRQGYAARDDLGGGVVLTLSHPLDYLRWLFGDVQSLWAFTAQSGVLGIPVDDQAEIGLQFSGGMLASLHLDYQQRPAAHWMEIVGTRGTLRWDNADGVVSLIGVGKEGKAGRRKKFAPPEGFERNAMFIEQTRHFRDVVQGTAEPVCTLEDGIAALRLALAAHQSAAEGKRVDF